MGDNNFGFDDNDIFGSTNQGELDESNIFGDTDISDDDILGNSNDFGDFELSAEEHDDANVDNNEPKLKKVSIIIIIAGIIGLIAVIIIASTILKRTKDKNDSDDKQYQNTTKSETTINTEIDGSNKDELMHNESETTAHQKKQDSNNEWLQIEGNESINFNDEYSSLLFTVTNIKHYAKSVDINNNLIVKTTLTGSIAGMSGTYSLDVPYNKGVKLVVGDSFTVNVQIGTYNNKTVIGEIKY